MKQGQKKPVAQLPVNQERDWFNATVLQALCNALGPYWRVHDQFIALALATLQHPCGGLTMIRIDQLQHRPQLLIYGNFQWLTSAGVEALGGNRGQHTLTLDASKTPAQVARLLKRNLLPAYWQDYEREKANWLHAHPLESDTTMLT